MIVPFLCFFCGQKSEGGIRRQANRKNVIEEEDDDGVNLNRSGDV